MEDMAPLAPPRVNGVWLACSLCDCWYRLRYAVRITVM